MAKTTKKAASKPAGKAKAEKVSTKPAAKTKSGKGGKGR